MKPQKLIELLDESERVYNRAHVFYRENLPIGKSGSVDMYAIRATWFFHLAKIKPGAVKRLGFKAKDDLFKEAMADLTRLHVEKGFPSFSISSLPGLKKRLKPFASYHKQKSTLKDAFGSVLNGRMNNDNSTKLGLEQQAVIISRFLDEKIGAKKLSRVYHEFAHKMIDAGLWDASKVLVSRATISAFLKKPSVINIRKNRGKPIQFKVVERFDSKD